jgi:DNA-binding MarR family transcriptional regulator
MNAPRKQSISDLIALIRKETRTATLFVQTVAESSGIHPTDIKCLDFLTKARFATAGDLAKVTGLTTGAITAVIDRMEKAGFIKRVADSNDRRKIIIKLLVKHPKHLQITHNLFANQMPKILSEYTSDEIAIITNWNSRLISLFQDEIKKLKDLKQKNSN